MEHWLALDFDGVLEGFSKKRIGFVSRGPNQPGAGGQARECMLDQC